MNSYRVSVTVGQRHTRYVATSPSWYAAWLAAIEQFGIGARIIVRHIDRVTPCA